MTAPTTCWEPRAVSMFHPSQISQETDSTALLKACMSSLAQIVSPFRPPFPNPTQSGAPRSSLVEAAEDFIFPAVCRHFPEAAGAAHVEFWAHCRRHSAGHQLHYDSDDEGVGGVRNPIVSSVLYLTGGLEGRPCSEDNRHAGGAKLLFLDSGLPVDI